MATTAETTLEAAIAAGYDALSDRELTMLIAYGALASGKQVLIDATAADPPVPSLPAVSYPTGGGTLSQWDVASRTWK